MLVSMFMALLQKFATQAVFEYLIFSLAEACVKSTNTDWDDKKLEELERLIGRK